MRNSFPVPEVLGPPGLQSGAWQPLASSPQPVCPLQTPLGGQPAPPAGRCGYGDSLPVRPPCDSAGPSHLVPKEKYITSDTLSFLYLLNL